ncbi:MAG: carbohydrate ABC transporter substrate-binding protein [Micromonosporaceae bacterium]|nr:carbohydrate ABC transporter substrate-binding protein [Micromonosporaceae bacterium]
MRPRISWNAVRLAIVTLTTASLILGGAAACGEEDGTVNLRFTWWGNADRAKLTEQVIDRFEQQHPGITVEGTYAEFTAYFQKLTTEVGGGGAADILQMDYRYVREYADRNALAEFTGNAAVDTSKLSDALLAGGTINGKLFALPLGQNTQGFTYDPTVWASAGLTAPALGWTWNDLVAATQRISDITSRRPYGVVDFGPIEDWFEVWLRQRAKSLYTEAGQLGYTADDVTAWWELTTRLRTSQAATEADLTVKLDGSQANDPMAKKLAASGFGYDSGMTPQTFEIFGREIALAPFPSDSDALGQYAKPSMQVCVFKRSKHPKEAAQFIDFFLNDPEAAKILALSRGMPVNSDNRAAVGQTLTGPPKVAYDYEQLVGPKLTDAPPPPPKGAGAVKTAFQRVYDDVLFDRATPREAAERLIKEAQQAIAE